MLKLATKFAPEPGAFAQARQAGYHCAELWLDAAVLADWRNVVELAQPHSLEYVLHFPNRPTPTAETLQHCVELYRALGCRCLVIHQPQFDRYHEELLTLEPALRLAIENHKLTPAQLERWAADSPGLTLDVEHLWKFTLSDGPLPQLLDAVALFLERHGDRLRHVHLPGYLPGSDEQRPMYCSREMVFGVLSLLAARRFEGFIVSESNPEYQNPAELRMDVLLVEAWQAQAAKLGKN